MRDTNLDYGLGWPGYASIVGVVRQLERAPSSHRGTRGRQLASTLAGAFAWRETEQGWGIWNEVWTNLGRWV